MLSGSGIQRSQTPAEGAALIFRIRRQHFLGAGTHAHIHAALIDFGPASNAGQLVFFNLGLPQLLTRLRIHSVNVRLAIAEISGELAGAVGSHRNGRTHLAGCLERPINTAGARIQRIDRPIVTSHENPASNNGWLAEDRADSRESEGPLDLQLWNILGANSGHIGGLHAAVDQIHTPSIPTVQIGERRRAGIARIGARRLDGGSVPGRQEIGNGLALGRAQHCSLRFHRTRFQSRHDGPIRHPFKSLKRWSPVSGVRFMAKRAVVLKQHLAIRRGLSGANPHK